VQLQHL